MLEKLFLIGSPGQEQSLFEDGVPDKSVTLVQPYQQAQASLSTGGRGGLGLSSTEARRMSASVESLMVTASEVLADLSGSIGDNVARR